MLSSSPLFIQHLRRGVAGFAVGEPVDVRAVGEQVGKELREDQKETFTKPQTFP